jgi:hypothetical protein
MTVWHVEAKTTGSMMLIPGQIPFARLPEWYISASTLQAPESAVTEKFEIGELAHFLDLPRYKWIFCISVSVFVVLFLLAFQPFGVTNFDPQFTLSLEFVLVVCAFGLVVLTTLAINEFLLRFLAPALTTWARLMVWLGWTYLLVGTVVYLFYNFLGDWHDLSWRSYAGFVRDIGMMITLPVAGFLFYIRHESLKSEFVQLQTFKAAAPSATLVQFVSDNLNENFSVALDDVLYLESQDNYLAVAWKEGDQPRSTLIRSSLKKQESFLSASSLVRCHRSFMVNLLRVRRCQGNQHGLKLGLLGTDRVIPVSRAYTAEVLQKLGDMQTAG